MLNLEWILATGNLGRTLLTNGALIQAIATGERCASSYVFPIVLAAVILPRRAIVLQGIGCALLSIHFTNLDSPRAYIQAAWPLGPPQRVRFSKVQQRMSGGSAPSSNGDSQRAWHYRNR